MLTNHLQNSASVYDKLKDNDCVIVAASRTPIGSFGGALASLPCTELGAQVIKKVMADSTLPADAVQEVYFGNVLSAGVGQAPARQAALGAGLPASTCCTTINKVCASGMKCISLAAQSIQLQLADVVIAGGMESMSNAPYYLPKARFGMRLGDAQVIDGLNYDGLRDPYYNGPMGIAGEKCALKFEITRQQQDEFAKASYQRTAKAYESGIMAAEICPVEVTDHKGNVTVVSADEEYKKVNLEKMGKLNPVFQKDGTITAANASKLSDGAAALLLVSGLKAKELKLPVLGRVLSFADAEVKPEDFPVSPSSAIPIALKRAGVQVADIDAFEINEAFASVPLANAKILGIDLSKLNQHGGAVSMGHPLGCSGARVVVTCLNVLRTNGGRLGCVGICNGGGGATSLVIERL